MSTGDNWETLRCKIPQCFPCLELILDECPNFFQVNYVLKVVIFSLEQNNSSQTISQNKERAVFKSRCKQQTFETIEYGILAAFAFPLKMTLEEMGQMKLHVLIAT